MSHYDIGWDAIIMLYYVDYHMHLEEGPYSFRWLDRTNQAFDHFHPIAEPRHSRAWLEASYARMHTRLQRGAYDESWLDLYLQEALRKGLREVGIVDHLYRFRETLPYFERHLDIGDSPLGRLQHTWLHQVCTERMEDFVATIQAAKPRWAEQGVELRLGLEADYFAGGEKDLESFIAMADWDYVIGSIHYVDGWGFDNPETQFRFELVDLCELYDRFFNDVERMINSGLFDIAAHLDNLKVFNYRPSEELLLPYYERIAQALKRTNTTTEVNAGLFYRYLVKEMCPSSSFIDVLLRHDVPFTLSSDSHFPDDVGKYVADNALMLQQRGLAEIATFHQRERIMRPLATSTS